MKIKQVLLNLLPVVLSLIHALLSKYYIVHYMISTYITLVVIGLLPVVYSRINHYLSDTIINLVGLNLVFTASQLIGFIVYDMVIVGNISDTFGYLAIPTIFYVIILVSISVLIKVIKRRAK